MGKVALMRSLIIFDFTKSYKDDQMKEDVGYVACMRMGLIRYAYKKLWLKI
jgi:hypothetical protein